MRQFLKVGVSVDQEYRILLYTQFIMFIMSLFPYMIALFIIVLFLSYTIIFQSIVETIHLYYQKFLHYVVFSYINTSLNFPVHT